MNQLGFPILSLITYLPLLGAFIIATLSGDEAKIACRARAIALGFSVLVLVLGVYVWTQFNTGIAGYQFVEAMPWLSGINVEYRMGVDGISLFLILLTLVLTRSPSSRATASRPARAPSSPRCCCWRR
ncbi:hypothetical protein [Acidocella sp. MX-AZ03]|uniref:hypothetical protein n=1 Tax=Acidocella sp. MX-AZ03 TaxID=2697363 RepID=UPI002FD84064